MSKVVSSLQNSRLSHIVKCNHEFYYVDSTYTFDHGLETMVFKCDGNGKNVNWHDLYVEWHSNFTEMTYRHKYIIRHLEEFLDEEEEQQ